MGELHISLAAEKIGSLFGFPITNSILTTFLVMILLIVFAYFATRSISLIPSTIQQIAEFIIETLYNLLKTVVSEKHIDSFFPLLATIFLFIIVSNWIGLLPGVGPISIKESKTETVQEEAKHNQNNIVLDESNTNHNENQLAKEEVLVEKKEAEHDKLIPLFRAGTADLNTTLAIAIIAMTSIQYFGFKSLGFVYLKKFFNFSNPINFYVGILELISEFSKIISFSFRLFGNIFAGEVLLTVIAFLMPIIAPLPFIGLELFVGFIQALVFSMLTAVFLKMATVGHEGH